MHYPPGVMEILQLDLSGRPQAWISAKEAAVLYASDGVAWTIGKAFYVLRGGMQRSGTGSGHGFIRIHSRLEEQLDAFGRLLIGLEAAPGWSGTVTRSGRRH